MDGDVTGALPGPQVFGNGTGFNASLQEVTFGSMLSFLISFSGAFETAASGDGTAFALGILDAGLAPLLGANPASGASLVFDLFPGADPTFVTYDDAISVSAIPEPGTYALLLAGLFVLLAAGRRAQRFLSTSRPTPPGDGRRILGLRFRPREIAHDHPALLPGQRCHSTRGARPAKRCTCGRRSSARYGSPAHRGPTIPGTCRST